MTCPYCGGEMIGDGYHEVCACENTLIDTFDMEPDAGPIYGCQEED